MRKSATADRNASTLECLSHAVERRAIYVFVDESKGERRRGGDAARQGLRGHGRDYDGRVNPCTVTVPAGVFEPYVLQDLRLDLDMELLADGFSHAMHLAFAARASLLIVSKVVFDTLARQVCRQRPASPLFARNAPGRRQASIRKLDVVVFLAITVDRSLFGLVEETVNMLLTAGCKAMELCQCQFFFQLDDPLRERFLLGFERGDFGSIGCQLRHQFCNARFAGARH